MESDNKGCATRGQTEQTQGTAGTRMPHSQAQGALGSLPQPGCQNQGREADKPKADKPTCCSERQPCGQGKEGAEGAQGVWTQPAAGQVQEGHAPAGACLQASNPKTKPPANREHHRQQGRVCLAGFHD